MTIKGIPDECINCEWLKKIDSNTQLCILAGCMKKRVNENGKNVYGVPESENMSKTVLD